MPLELPIDPLLPQIVAALQQHPTVIVQAPPGAGKTTRVPPALIDGGVVGRQQLLMIQPRRIAARTTAQRMADERPCRIGEEVGYQIRFERKASARTRLLVVTEGILVQRLLADPFLEGIGGVILDEFHERHLETDLSLAMLRRVQQTVRPDLKLVVMSATLAADVLQRYLHPAPVITCTVRTHPVAIEYAAAPVSQRLEQSVAEGVRRLASETTGHLLAFLPGVGEILRTRAELIRQPPLTDCEILPLYGDLSASEQDRVFRETGARKVILATNVAETSVTIPGVTGVVDAGLARQQEFDSATGLNRLVLRPISQASAEQRAGRAGRTGPGRCLRLWSEAAQRVRPPQEIPELCRLDLSGVVLQLKAWGEADLQTFPWFEAPVPAAISQADRLLQSLDALDARGVTPLGQLLSRLPVAPRLGRLIHEGAQRGCLTDVVRVAALLSERDPFQRRDVRRVAAASGVSDLDDRLDCLQTFQSTGRTEFDLGTLSADSARRVLQVAEQLSRIYGSIADDVSTPAAPAGARHEAIARAILAAYPDRLVRRREPGSCRGLMVGGRGVELSPASSVREAPLFVAVDVEGAAEEALVRLAVEVRREWLPEEHLTSDVVVEFDEKSGRVQARQQVRWFDLVLQQSPGPLPTDGQVEVTLAQAAQARWDQIFPPDDPDVAQLIARVACLREWMPEFEWPDWSLSGLQALLPHVVPGCRSLAELRGAPWQVVLRGQLSPAQRSLLDREAPERVQVPSGSRIAIEYAAGKPPVLAVRIQEIFGWQQTPRIAGGRIKLLLHLLAPNYRPQQITDDLASFWTTAYPLIRGELRRRYPRHAWPEDPRTATPERRPPPRKS